MAQISLSLSISECLVQCEQQNDNERGVGQASKYVQNDVCCKQFFYHEEALQVEDEGQNNDVESHK